jgi:glycosyltransferase involved in cell wall biosynthesis
VPLVFFHFSGFDPAQPGVFSKHQDRYQLGDLDVVGDLTRQYTARLEANGSADCQRWDYAYGFLSDGSPIPDAFRRLYRTTASIADWAGDNPFAKSCSAWNEPIDAMSVPFTRAMLAVYQGRPDLRLSWPDPMGADRQAFASWYVQAGDLQGLIPKCYVDPIRGAIASGDRSQSPGTARRFPSAPIDPALISGAARKAYVALREGRLPLSPARWHQLFQLHRREHAQQQLAVTGLPLPSPHWLPAPGLNVVGYLSEPTGVGAAAHLTLEACAEVGLATDCLDACTRLPGAGRHAINLFHVNADQMPVVAEQFGSEFFRNRHTIGVWAWELPAFPDAYLRAFDWVDEVWAGSRFIQAAIAERASVPVIHMPYPVSVTPQPHAARADWNLPEHRFLFLMMYDALSVQERKNPLAALAAFRRAFPASKDVGLVVKVSHAASRPEAVDLVRKQIDETEGAFLVDSMMSRADVHALQASCDAFVSLHRSEGFGLNIAEAMLLRKPVVVTGWSGNLDFTTARNACLVDYRLVRLDRDYGPYRAGNHWAEPDLDHAASLMVRVVEDVSFRETIAGRGQSTIATEFSPKTIGTRYQRRLANVLLQRRSRAARAAIGPPGALA